jgi:hypothetical protein
VRRRVAGDDRTEQTRVVGLGRHSGDVYGRSRGCAADRFGIITLRLK